MEILLCIYKVLVFLWFMGYNVYFCVRKFIGNVGLFLKNVMDVFVFILFI